MDDVVSRSNALATQGRTVEAALLLERSAAAGDARAALTLAYWRLQGNLIRRDLEIARELFGKAADLGLADAEPIYIALLGNGAGSSGRSWVEALARLQRGAEKDLDAASQLALLADMSIDEHGEPISPLHGKELRSAPEIRHFPSFLTSTECAYVISHALPRLQPSVVVHPTTRALIQDAVRTSTVAVFPFIEENPVLHAINRRIAAATGTRYEQGEPLQVLSYEPGQQYKLHSDTLPGHVNQRILTFLVYLNHAYQGGETVFPDLNLSFRGAAGDGLLFCNVTADAVPHPHARHAGLPVTRGQKLLLSKWIRAQPLELAGPAGRPL